MDLGIGLIVIATSSAYSEASLKRREQVGKPEMQEAHRPRHAVFLCVPLRVLYGRRWRGALGLPVFFLHRSSYPVICRPPVRKREGGFIAKKESAMMSNWISTPKASPAIIPAIEDRSSVVCTSTKPINQERILTVGLYPEFRAKKPWIRLYGMWLKEAGFNPRTKIKVRVMQGCLVITAE